MGYDAIVVLVMGLLLALALAGKAAGDRIGLPAAVVFLAVGLAFAGVRAGLGLTSDHALGGSQTLIHRFGEMGVVIILFRIGLESDCRRLWANLRRACPVWLVNMLVSAGLGFLAAWALGYGFVVQLVVGTALAATSVGIPAAIWIEQRALHSETGQLFVDVAELDDISGIIALSLVLAVVPHLGDDGAVRRIVLVEGGWLLLALTVIAGGAFVFSYWIRPWLTRALEKWEGGPDEAVSVVALAMIVAAGTAMAGLSLAVGAFVAGLVFSPDRQEIRRGASFTTLYDTLSPFFFISVGMGVTGITMSWATALTIAVIVIAAMAGKVVGTAAPMVPWYGWHRSITMGVSMMPRAEITMIIALAARSYLPDAVYTALVLTCLITAMFAGSVLPRLLAGIDGASRSAPASR